MLPSTFKVAALIFLFAALCYFFERSHRAAYLGSFDVAAWPVVVTAILAGPPLTTMVVETIGRSCRVLTVSEETAEGIDGARGLDDRLRLLLPLEVGRVRQVTASCPNGLRRDVDRRRRARFHP